MIDIAAIATIVFVVAEAIKGTKVCRIPTKLLPIINLIVAVVGAFALYYDGDWRATLFNAVVAGLTASGAYSGCKNVYQYYTHKGDWER